ncbi:PspA/IM30 family protein [Corynebacterium heidelbergense]|uniref:PspA/IM30 family protein n=1 Tax=Corynebacterium heidelbergense TaxID=2055947 RepID=A0A364V3W7_9CORY|nr:PspA/IM30 family protein [Corynebacterium heidelbergense]RAV31322.1 hypothetical protein DLJ54_08960 [Corynebacterium heidelbergense]
MPNPFSKGWKYLTQSLDAKIDENADPKVQIQQAADEARRRHRAITEQAAAVIGNCRQLEMKLNRLQEDAARLQDNAKSAMMQADAAQAAGDAAKAQQLNQTAELLASQLVSVEQQIDETKQMHAGAKAAAEQAAAQQQQSDARLQEQLGQISELRAQADQAKMQEATAQSIQQMDSITGTDPDASVPTLDQVRDKIEQRYATALGSQELVQDSVQGRMDEVAAASTDMRASSRLEQIRAEMKKGELTSGGSREGRDNPGAEQPESE